MAQYSTRVEADTYFGERLHSTLWDASSVSDRNVALIQASRIIDDLDYKGLKNAAYLVWLPLKDQALTDANKLAINVAGATQVLEFPRGVDTVIPDDIKEACNEIAFALLDGRDPDADTEGLSQISQGFSSVRSTYTRAFIPEHLVNGVPSATAWRRLKKYVKDKAGVRVSRVS